jgi:serine O-acetyltransferase
VAVFDIDDIVQSLQTVRQNWREVQKRSLEPGGRDLPAREALAGIVDALKGVLFPMRLGPPDLRQESENFYVANALDSALHALLAQARLELNYKARHHARSDESIETQASHAVRQFAARLPEIRSLLDSDVLAAFHGDPAAGSVDEVLLCYPGILAMIHHRLAHELYRLELPLLARIVAEHAHAATGIDIHPGAQIGAGFFIDHGTGVVIGETAVIGQRVRVYQAVTLGAKRFPRNAAGHLEKARPASDRRGRCGDLCGRNHSWQGNARARVGDRRQCVAHPGCCAGESRHAGRLA